MLYCCMLGDDVRCHLAMTIMHTKTITRNSKYNILYKYTICWTDGPFKPWTYTLTY